MCVQDLIKAFILPFPYFHTFSSGGNRVLSFCFICSPDGNLVTLSDKSTDMSTIKIPQNGLPQGLTNIPFGQVFVLTDPSQGITSTTTQKIGAVISIAGSLGQSHIVYALPVDDPNLWDCFICKVKTEEGIQVLVSDKDSLLEMLCEFWGLDYNEVCKSFVFKKRYQGKISLGGESHPIRIPVPASNPGCTLKENDDRITLQNITDHSREKTISDIRSTFKDNFSYGWDITPEDVLKIFEEEKAATKTYRLDIQVVWKEVIEKAKPIKKIKSCDISLIDNEGNKYPLKMKAQSKAIYLTFILYKEGLRIQDVSGNKEFYKQFSKIFDQMPRALGKPASFVFFDKEDKYTKEYGFFNDKLNNIRKAILNATDNNEFLRERFAVEGKMSYPYKVAGATDEHRALIRKEFGLK